MKKNSEIIKQITVFSGCVVRDKKILMVERSEPECPDAHLKWEFPGGKCDLHETPQEAVAREIFEETGRKISVKKLLPFVQTSYWKYEWGTQQTFCFVFICELVEDGEPKILDHHVKKIEWVEFEKVKDLPILPGTDEVLKIISHEKTS